MKNTMKKRFLIVACSLMLVLWTAACGEKTLNDDVTSTSVSVSGEVEAPVDTESEASVEAEPEKIITPEPVMLGEGSTQFSFEVVDGEGNLSIFIINTDKKTVGEALLDVALVEGDDSEYGLYVKKVNGITADYDVDKTYWAFYIDGEYASTGVSQTDVVANTTYAFKVEK